MKEKTHQMDNGLLSALRESDFALLKPHLERWDASVREKIYNPGDSVTHVYFPCGSSVASFLVILEGGQPIEAALVGREGAVGGVVSDGLAPAYARSEVHAPGLFLRLASRKLEEAKLSSAAIRGLFSRYADCLLAQVFQSVACNAVHTIEQRTAKWLLSTLDRTGGEDILVTQDQFALMLGVGRSYFNQVVKCLKSKGLIETGRGFIRVRDRTGLERISCRCDITFRRHFRSLLDGIYPQPQHDHNDVWATKQRWDANVSSGVSQSKH